jgi:hypothetical protein
LDADRASDPTPNNSKSAFRIHLDDFRRLRRWLAYGGCDYLGLLLNLRSAPPFALGDAIAMAGRRENSWFKVR